VSIPRGGGLAGEDARDEVSSDPPLGASHCGHAKVGRDGRRRKVGERGAGTERCSSEGEKGSGFQLLNSTPIPRLLIAAPGAGRREYDARKLQSIYLEGK
jgi:hypothetical protein